MNDNHMVNHLRYHKYLLFIKYDISYLILSTVLLLRTYHFCAPSDLAWESIFQVDLPSYR